MSDAMLRCAFSVHGSKGAYAVLLGSGVSRPAGIPTGWEITLDLIRQLAKMEGEDCGPQPDIWFKERFGADAGYDILLEKVAASPADRSALLRRYIEPTEEERADGLKQPTKAHRAIAELVAKGYVRVIVTMNFDRLMETALAAEGVTPTVISASSDIAHVAPLHQSPCTIVKVHGDYVQLDTRNIASELVEYDDAMNAKLAQIFDEYGLIVAGWSAAYDKALCAAINGCSTHRFATYWAKRGDLAPEAQTVIDNRRADVIAVPDADTFFVQLAEKVAALEDMAKPTTLSTQVAVATLKRYLPDPAQYIRQHELIQDATERALIAMPNVETIETWDAQALTQVIHQQDAAIETLRALIIAGCYWGGDAFDEPLLYSLSKMSDPTGREYGIGNGTKPQLFGALHLLYGAGIAALAKGNITRLLRLLTQVKVRAHSKLEPASNVLFADGIIDRRLAKQANLSRSPLPVSGYLWRKLRDGFRAYPITDEEYRHHFNAFEYWQGLLYADADSDWTENRLAGPMTAFATHDYFDPDATIGHILREEAQRMGDAWSPLQMGVFDGKLERFLKVSVGYDAYLAKEGRMTRFR